MNKCKILFMCGGNECDFFLPHYTPRETMCRSCYEGVCANMMANKKAVEEFLEMYRDDFKEIEAHYRKQKALMNRPLIEWYDKEDEDD